MKQKFSFLLTLCMFAFVGQTTAQEDIYKDSYIPLLGDTNVWYMAERMEFGEIINYKRVTGNKLVINDTTYTWIEDGNGQGGYALLRENIEEKKVYKRQSELVNSEEFVLYDFSLQEGDSIFISEESYSWFYVDSVKYTDTYAGYRKTWFLRSEWDDEFPVWIEGIGSLSGLLVPSKQPNLNWWEFPELLCAEYNNEIVYKSDNGTTYGCDFELFDQTPPTADSIWFEPDTIVSSDTVYFYVRAYDDISGIMGCNAWVYSSDNTEKFLHLPLTHKYGDIYYNKISYCMWNELGLWSLYYIEIYDNAYNGQSQTFFTGNEASFFVKEITGIENNFPSKIKLFPNPVADVSILEFENKKNELIELHIYNTLGSLVQRKYTNENVIKIYRNDFKKGIYFYKLTNKNKILKSSKFIIK